MESTHNTRLTSAEISNLWTTYINDTVATCILGYAISKVNDSEIKSVLLTALNTSLKHISKIKDIYKKEKHAIPIGFSEKDVNLEAPALFTDAFFLHYVKQMGRVGLGAYSLSYILSERSDIRTFFRNGIDEAAALDEHATSLLQSKGILRKAPCISIPTESKIVENTGFLGGLLGQKRPLLALEVTNLFNNVRTISFAKALVMGFSQVAESKKVREFMVRGRELAHEHIDTLSDILSKNNVKLPSTWDDEVTNSTIALFSDRLMMHHLAALLAVRLADYGASISTTMTQDLSAIYTKISAEVALYAKDCADIMLKNGWMEQPPQADDRDELAKK